MNIITLTIAQQFIKNIFKQKLVYVLLGLFLALLTYAAITGKNYISSQNKTQLHYQELTRKSWESNPNKHPHRMAHYGSFALRIKHPLSVFDYGIDNYAGNAVYLEAHKQNTVNYSEVSFSTGLLRMGELSIAMLLQIIVPLIIFFLGFGSIAADKENATLKIIASQGASNFQLLFGRTLGLWGISFLFLIPAFLTTAIIVKSFNIKFIGAEVSSRYLLTAFLYLSFYWVLATITIMISAKSNTAKSALIKLLGVWLFLAIVMPKVTRVASNKLYNAPSKLSFETAIEKDIVKQGDSHNPDDPFFKKLKDSVLKKYGVKSKDSLPVNLAGIVGTEAEQLSTITYAKHYKDLTNIYRKQNMVDKVFGFANPFMMTKQNSMALSGSDFEAYVHFQLQAEAYRYKLAQYMNKLQTKFISNKTPKEGSHLLHINANYFSILEDFNMQFLSLKQITKNESVTIITLFYWLILSYIVLIATAKNLKLL